VRALILGGGGREHALAWKLKRDDPTLELLAAPGNPGIGELARCVAVSATDAGRVVELATAEHVDLVGGGT
jgi:phosphoribosylamine--glycine ligase